MKINRYYPLLALAAIGISCQKQEQSQEQATVFTIAEGKEMQSIDGFGASDAWTMQWVGQWPDSVRRQVAQWLFSGDTDPYGQPKGIALSIWRYNIGGGSQEQGDTSQIDSKWTRAESPMLLDGSGYDWDKMEGQRWMLRQARDMGVPVVHAFLNSPHVSMTQNGLATNTGRDSTFNLQADKYEEFAAYIADIIEGIAAHDSVTFSYVSPFNEPDAHWNWFGPKQEGTPATNKEIAKAVRLLSKELSGRQLPTQILISESSDYRCMYSTHETCHERGYQIQQFFTPDSTDTYIGDLPNVPRLIGGHSYWTNTPLSGLYDYRKTLRDTLQSRDVKFWQTEICIMSNDDELNGGWRFDPTMKTALYVARIIHHDLAIAGASSWSWWRAAAPDGYKDQLIGLKASDDLMSGTAQDSKLMWALGNYSRFVRPGAVRLDVESDHMRHATDPVGLMCSAYRNADGTKAIVMINYGDEDTPVTFKLADEVMLRPYLTAKGKDNNLRPLDLVISSDSFTMPARSIVTFIEE